MECPNHLGKDMVLVLSDPEVCSACGQKKPTTQVGFKCVVCGTRYNMDSSEYAPNLPKAEPAAKVKKAKAKVKKAKTKNRMAEADSKMTKVENEIAKAKNKNDSKRKPY